MQMEMMIENRAGLLSVPSWINWKVVYFPFFSFVSTLFLQTCPDLLFFSPAEKEQTPLQEALNQLIRQLQRCTIEFFIDFLSFYLLLCVFVLLRPHRSPRPLLVYPNCRPLFTVTNLKSQNACTYYVNPSACLSLQ